MLAELAPLMPATVRHYQPGQRDIHGRPLPGSFTEHRARVSRKIGVVPGPASKEDVTLPSATVWLLDYPHEIALGHVFQIEPGDPLDVIGLEVRDTEGVTITKVYLK